jgi:tetratricopeptide (TPR) repeat protein
VRKLRAFLICLGFSGCVGSATEHEKLGDQAYAERRFADALTEYRLRLVQHPGDREVRAKAAAAALNGSDLEAAVDEYVALADGGSDRNVAEAADGLARVVRVAADSSDQTALARAVGGLRQVVPGRALGDFAGQLALGVGEAPPSEDVLSVLLYAAAGAPDARLQDSLMYSYAATLRRLGRCEEAVPVLESLMRRQMEPAVIEQSRAVLGFCAYSLGERARDENLPLSAEQWFLLAIRKAGPTQYGRRSYLGLGDILFARGEFVAAAVAYESALLGGEPDDAISQTALTQLEMVERAGTGIP